MVKESGKNIIRMKTDQPFRDPFLHFIINAKWSNGAMLREYTALLDPPSYLTGQAASIKAPTVTAPVVVAAPTPAKSSASSTARPSARRAAMQKEVSKPAAASTAVAAPTSPAEADTRKLGPGGIEPSTGSNYSDLRPGGTYGPVKKGDALWNIAEDVKAGTQLGIAQVIMAIYKQNPDAFLRNNINLIRTGQTLQIPSDGEISSTSRSVAQAELQEQMNEWQAYRDGLSSGSQTARVSYGDVTEGSGASDSKATVTGETTASEGKEDQRGRLDQGNDVLEIIRADVNKADTTGSGVSDDDRTKFKNEISAYKENVGLLEESLASSELEKKELSERVLLLEQQIDKANKLIDMQSAGLAQMQGKAATEKASDDYMKSMEKVAQAPVKPIMPAETASSKMSAPDLSPIVPAKPVVKKPPVAKKPVVKKPATENKAKKTRVKPKPVEQKGMMDTVMDFVTSSWMTMLGAVLAIVLVLVGLFVVFRRRRSIAEFEDSIISGTAVLDISTAESTEPSDSGSETSFLSDFVPGMGNMQADEVDPLAEAEVYMAYGRDEQAEEVLKEAAS
ncbi:MAG: hypothetical protein KAJ95_08030, partial [Gammaproteobacteria bacterium]|nr:hypothetical protein [Gammaproteobacteria bacterium]